MDRLVNTISSSDDYNDGLRPLQGREKVAGEARRIEVGATLIEKNDIIIVVYFCQDSRRLFGTGSITIAGRVGQELPRSLKRALQALFVAADTFINPGFVFLADSEDANRHYKANFPANSARAE